MSPFDGWTPDAVPAPVRKNLPTEGDRHVDGLLTNISVAYSQEAANFIADSLLPTVLVDKRTDLIAKYNKGDWQRDELERKTRGTPAAHLGYRTDNTDSYRVEGWAGAVPVYDEDRDAQDAPYDADEDATEFLTQKVLLRKEKQLATDFFGASIWDTELTGVAGSPGANQFKQWDQAGSTPILDLEQWLYDQAELTGFFPNTIAIGPQVWRVLKSHDDVLSRITGVERGVVSADVLSNLLSERNRFPINILTPLAVENTANEGAAASNSFIHGKKLLLGYVNPRPSLRRPSMGYTFAWRRPGVAANGMRVKRYRVEAHEADIIEMQTWFDMKVVQSDMGTLASAVVG